MRLAEFEALVSDALQGLPAAFKELMHNVDVVVQGFPTKQQIRENGVSSRYDLLGLYEGVPLTERDGSYEMVLPDKITVFRGPLESIWGDSVEDLTAEIRSTVRHELAHHFGISDEQLDAMDRY